MRLRLRVNKGYLDNFACMEGFCILASGSKGNAIYVGTRHTKVLVDLGISCKSVLAKLQTIGVKGEDIDAVIVSHEHSDHIKGLEVFTKKHGTPIFANSETAKAICAQFSQRPKLKIFTTGELFAFGDLEVHPFSVQHDTLDPVAFTITYYTEKLGICTDLGFATTLVKAHLSNCNYLVLEANHDENMVHACNRPTVYKQRVLGRQGHLSNQSCAELLEAIYSTQLQRVFLAHLSSECNAPIAALETVMQHLEKAGKNVDIEVATQTEVSRFVAFRGQEKNAWQIATNTEG